MGVKPVARWSAAAAVTVAAFAAAAWVSGALILPAVIRDPGIRWGLAGSVGVAVAALGALWGSSFAAGDNSPEADSGSSDAKPAPGRAAQGRGDKGRGDTRNEITGGTFHGPVIQSRDFSGPADSGAVPARPLGPED
jgi:hypothetical protein